MVEKTKRSVSPVTHASRRLARAVNALQEKSARRLRLLKQAADLDAELGALDLEVEAAKDALDEAIKQPASLTSK